MRKTLQSIYEHIFLASVVSIVGGVVAAYLLDFTEGPPETKSSTYTLSEMERLGIWIDTVSSPEARYTYQIPEERHAAAQVSKDQLTNFVVQCENRQAVMWLGQRAENLPSSHPVLRLEGMSSNAPVPFELRFSDGSTHDLFAFRAPGRFAAGTLLPQEIVAAFRNDSNQFTVYIFGQKAGSFMNREGTRAMDSIFQRSACSHVLAG